MQAPVSIAAHSESPSTPPAASRALQLIETIKSTIPTADRMRTTLALLGKHTNEAVWSPSSPLPDKLEHELHSLGINYGPFHEIKEAINSALIDPLIIRRQAVIEALVVEIENGADHSDKLQIVLDRLTSLELREIVTESDSLIALCAEIAPPNELESHSFQNSAVEGASRHDARFLILRENLIAIAAEKKPDELRSIRASLMERTGLQSGTVLSIGAYVKIKADKVVGMYGEQQFDRQALLKASAAYLGGQTDTSKSLHKPVQHYLSLLGIAERTDSVIEPTPSIVETEVQPTPSPTDFRQLIIRSLLLLYANGANRSDLREARTSLATSTGLDERQVASIGAHILIKAQRLAAESGCSSLEIISSASARLRGQNGVNFSNDLGEKLLSQLGIDPNTNAETVGATSDTIDRDTPTGSSLRVEVEANGGAYANYDNPIKQKWRQTWYDFLERTTTPEWRSGARLLCLPSAEPSREVDGYLKLGFSPENIIAVERDRRVQDLFLKNCGRLGIQPVFGELQSVVEAMKKPLDVASLDFLGPVSNSVSDTLKLLPLAEEAVVLVNVMAKREQRIMQSTFSVLSDPSNRKGSTIDTIMQRWSARDKLAELATSLDNKIRRDRREDEINIDLENSDMRGVLEDIAANYPEYDEPKEILELLDGLSKQPDYDKSVSESRDKGLPQTIVALLGTARRDFLNFRSLHSNVSETFLTGCCSKPWMEMDGYQQFEHLSAATSTAVEFLLTQIGRRFSLGREKLGQLIFLGDLAAIGYWPLVKVLEGQEVLYTSPVSSSNTPYHTVQVKLRNPNEYRNACVESLRFLQKIARHFIELPTVERELWSGLELFVSNTAPLNGSIERFRASTEHAKLKGDQWITVRMQRPGVKPSLATIQLSTLIRDARRTEAQLKGLLNNGEAVDNFPRIHLSNEI